MPISGEEIERTRLLAMALWDVPGASTAREVAQLSDAKLKTYISTARGRNRREAIKRMWELEEWFTRRS